MNHKIAREYFMQCTQNCLEIAESEEIFRRIAEHLSGLSYSVLRSHNEFSFSKSQLDEIITQLQKHVPIQYILGYEWFGPLQLMVNPHVLIPRPETEELCLWVISDLKQESEAKQLIDIGTGSGCIPLYLKKHLPQHNISGLDVSPEALQIAGLNADRYDLGIQWLLHDILDPELRLGVEYDLIISNPPYIRRQEIHAMQSRVLDYEPHQALFVHGDDALQFYKALLHFAETHLQKNGSIYLELHQDYAQDVKLLYSQHAYHTELRKDIHGHHRMMKAWRNG